MKKTEEMVVFVLAVLAFSAALGQAATSSAHPLDPLSQSELGATVDVLKSAGHIDENTRFVYVTLREPDKTEVLKWKPGTASAREAFAIIKQGSQTYEAVVDVSAPKLESWKEIKGVQPALLIDEMQRLNDTLRADGGWQTAMRKRGFRQFDKIACMPFSAG